MTNKFKQFNDLHHAQELFVLPNVWNAKSALIFQENNYPAIATSSAAVAESLGYQDGEQMPFSAYLFIIKRILATVNIPFSVDMEMGYGHTADEIYTNLQSLIQLGVVGINLEDSTLHRGERSLKPAKTFAATLEALKSRLLADGLDLFINVRCDTYILDVKNKEKETKERVGIYENSGADGIFLPCIAKEQDIAAAVEATKLPINVMAIPGLPDVDVLSRLGVKRLSMGPAQFNKIYSSLITK